MSGHCDFFELIQQDYAQNDLKCRIKRTRCRCLSLTTFQEEQLEEAYQNSPYLTRQRRKRLEFCEFLALTETQVVDWFAKRRLKERAYHTDNNGNKRKFSLRYEPEVVFQLEEAYLKNNYQKRSSLTKIAERLGLTVRQVQKWFLNRRRRQRKLEKNIDNEEQLEVDVRSGLSLQEAKISSSSDRRIRSDWMEVDDEILVKYIANIRPEEVDDLIESLEKYFNQDGLFDL